MYITFHPTFGTPQILICHPISPLPSHQACHHPTLLRLLKAVKMRCTAKKRLLVVHTKTLRFSFLHDRVLPPGGTSVSNDTVQCSELQGGWLQPKSSVSQARRWQRRARVKPGGHRGGRIGRRGAPTNNQGLDGGFVQA